MNNTDAAMPALRTVKGTPQEMRETVAKALTHPHLLSFTYLDSKEVACGRITAVQLGQDKQETEVRVTLSSGDRIIIYIPCRSESATVTSYTFSFGTPENSVSDDV